MSQLIITLWDEFTDDTELTERERHELLAAEQRRLVLEALAARTDTATLTGVATDVAERKSERGSPDREAITHTKIELHHSHLPKLDDFGVIEYDPSTHRIEL